MLKKVFDYIKEYQMCTANQIADELGIRGVDALASVNELCVRGFLEINTIPLGINNDNSPWYSAIKQEFADNSEFCICKKLHTITSDVNSSEWGYWDTCCICGKHLEDGFHPYNHYDGEDHDDIDF